MALYPTYFGILEGVKFKHGLIEVWARVRLFGLDLTDYFFKSRESYFTKWLGVAALLAMFVIGLALWGNFLAWGKIDFTLGDWNVITGPRLTALQDALLTGQAPLHVSDFMGLKGLTDRYLSIPDMFLSPQGVLLQFMEPGTFVLVNTLLLYAVGFLGLLVLKKKYGLSLAAFTVLFLLFNFNGSITAHLAIGHFTWLGYFLLPFFALLMLSIPAGKVDWGWLLKVGLLMTVIFIQGTFHLYVWCLIFLGLVGLLSGQARKMAFLAIVFSLALGLFRILPAALNTPVLNVEFLTGFTNSGDFLRGMVEVVQPSFDYLTPGNEITHLIGWWEFDFYLGWIGLGFVAWFGGWVWLREKKAIPGWAAQLYGPMLVMLVLSMGRIYKPIFMLQIPLLTAERVTSRFWILPLVFLFVLGAIGFQKTLADRNLSKLTLLAYFGSLGMLINDLLRHLDLWNVKYMDQTLPAELNAYALHIQNNPADVVYLNAIAIGCLLSLAALAFLLFQYGRSQLHPRHPSK
jgi:hypothetical protein